MDKTLNSFITKLQQNADGTLQGGFASVRGGFNLSVPSNNEHACDNSGACDNTTNLAYCTNKVNCTGSSNDLNCTNGSCYV